MLPFLIAFAVAIAPGSAADSPTSAFYEALRAADLRLATIAYRLTTANSALCDRIQPQLGMPIHAITQYAATEREQVRAVFGFEAVVAVEAVVAGGPAARAGILAGDSIDAIADRPQPMLPGGTLAGANDRDAAERIIADLSPGHAIDLGIVRKGRRVTVHVDPVPGCRSRFEIVLGSGFGASADGSVVQLGEKFFEQLSDAEIAVVVAHELAHNILHHRDRLDAAGVSRGMTSELGRNGRLIRRTEDEADRLGVYLLVNAGYAPASAAQFWRMHGGLVDGGVFRSRTHASSKARAEALAAVAATIPANPAHPLIPDLIATRGEPLR